MNTTICHSIREWIALARDSREERQKNTPFLIKYLKSIVDTVTIHSDAIRSQKMSEFFLVFRTVVFTSNTVFLLTMDTEEIFTFGYYNMYVGTRIDLQSGIDIGNIVFPNADLRLVFDEDNEIYYRLFVYISNHHFLFSDSVVTFYI